MRATLDHVRGAVENSLDGAPGAPYPEEAARSVGVSTDFLELFFRGEARADERNAASD